MQPLAFGSGPGPPMLAQQQIFGGPRGLMQMNMGQHLGLQHMVPQQMWQQQQGGMSGLPSAMGPPRMQMAPHGMPQMQQHLQMMAPSKQHMQLFANMEIERQREQMSALANELRSLQQFAANQAREFERMTKERDASGPGVPPPAFPHLHPGVIFDHLILRALDPSIGGTGGAAEAGARLCSQPHLGVSLSPTDISFKPAVPGAVQEMVATLRNSSEQAIRLRQVRFVGPISEPPPFTCAKGPPDGGAILIPASSEYTLTVRCEAPEERGLSRQWLFALVEAVEADARTVRIASFALAATVALYTFHEESITLLSAEAPPFFPAELRGLWQRPATRIEPPAAYFPSFQRVLECDTFDEIGSSDSTVMWEAAAQAATTQLKQLSPTRPAQYGQTFLSLHDNLLFIEERQHAEHYERMDVFTTEVRGSRPRDSFIFTVDVPGLQELHPPVTVGDALLLRLNELPDLELGLRVTAVDRRTILKLQPSNSRSDLLDLARQLAGPQESFANGVKDVEALISGGRALCHLRFLLNRSLLQYMEHTVKSTMCFHKFLHELAASAAAAMPALRKCAPPLLVAISPDAEDANARVHDGDPSSPYWRPHHRSLVRHLEPIQPQINREQLQAVRDILIHEHGSVPYLVFGPPGTGKTMVSGTHAKRVPHSPALRLPA